MKNASPAALAILSGGSYLRADLYQITLSTGAVYYFTASDTTLNAYIYPSGTYHNFLTGFTITRGSVTQAAGLDTQEMDLKIAPQYDNPGGQPLIAGYTIMQSARLGLLDNATVLFAKMFLSYPSPGTALDTSPGAVAWFQGIVGDTEVHRFDVELKISSNLIILNQLQMPRNLYQASCSHTLYDAGCTLSKTAFTVTGHITSVVNNASFGTSLTQATNYFNLGAMKFTSGANNGFQTTVKLYTNGGGAVQTQIGFPATVAVGDTFTIYPGCDHLQSTCSGKFNNLAHFKGMPYTPVPETLYDGGTPDDSSTGVTTNITPSSGISGNITIAGR